MLIKRFIIYGFNMFNNKEVKIMKIELMFNDNIFKFIYNNFFFDNV